MGRHLKLKLPVCAIMQIKIVTFEANENSISNRGCIIRITIVVIFFFLLLNIQHVYSILGIKKKGTLQTQNKTSRVKQLSFVIFSSYYTQKLTSLRNLCIFFAQIHWRSYILLTSSNSNNFWKLTKFWIEFDIVNHKNELQECIVNNFFFFFFQMLFFDVLMCSREKLVLVFFPLTIRLVRNRCFRSSATKRHRHPPRHYSDSTIKPTTVCANYQMIKVQQFFRFFFLS